MRARGSSAIAVSCPSNSSTGGGVDAVCASVTRSRNGDGWMGQRSLECRGSAGCPARASAEFGWVGLGQPGASAVGGSQPRARVVTAPPDRIPMDHRRRWIFHSIPQRKSNTGC
jgi:hypothetical protein